MKNNETVLSLTGRDSHRLSIPAGQGSLSIGTRGLSEGKYDLWVEPDETINWDAFNEQYTGYGRTRKEELPYGDWPRWIYYSGNDTGFIAWSAKRKIEEFYWMPKTDLTVDFTPARIHDLSIQTGEHRIRFSTGKNIVRLTLAGTLENICLEHYETLPALTFCPAIPKGKPLCRLPEFPNLTQADGVNVRYSLAKIPFDCGSLRQFANLRSLNLYGSMTNLSALQDLDKLEHLALRDLPDLEGMPRLSCWENLGSFIGYNIESTAGKALRTELSLLKKTRPMQYASVTKLRERSWFDSEYGILFSSWEEKNARNAAKAYKKCVNRIKKAGTEEEIHRAVREFIGAVNRMDGIETGERDDVGVAVGQLAEYAPITIPADRWYLWFEEERQF